MNIIEAEDMVKGLPDQVLFQYAQSPPPTIPQFLVVSEVQRRQDMRQRFQAQQQQQQGTVKDQILQGIGGTGMAPEMSSPPPMAPQMPQGGPPMGGPPPGGPPPVAAFRGGMMPYGMAGGGSVPPGQANPQVLRNFLQRNFGTPQGLATNIGMVGGALLGGPLGSVAGANIGSYLGDKMSRSVEMSDWDRARLFAKPFSQAADQQEVPAEPPPFVDGMAMGGQIPYRMQEGRQAPTESEIREALSTLPRNRTPRQTEIARAALSSSEYNPITSRLYGMMYGNPQMPGAEPAPVAPRPAAPAAAAAPVRPPAVEAGIPTAGMALASAAPPATPPAPPAAPPMAAAVTPPAAPPVPPPVPPPAATPPAAQPAGPVSDYQSRVDQLTGSLPGIMGQIQSLTPQVSSLTLQDLQRFAPKPFDDSEIMARREALLNQLQQTGRTRREEDIAAAERYRSEAETPIQSAQEEARKTAIASTLMRLGAGLAAGKPAEGLASASEAVENIMTRAREQATAERRAVRQEFRQAEREATRGERDVANTVFQMQAQQITSDESKQRELTRDQMQFAQWAFGQIRDQGRDSRQAYTDAMRLSLDVSKTVQSVLNEELKNERISKDQYTTIAGALLRTVNETLRQNLPENMDLSTPKGRQDLNDMATDLVKTQLQSLGISSPDNLAVTSFEEVSPTSLKVNGQTINFKTEEQANAFKKSIGR